MALPSSGAITFANVNTELGAGSTTQRSLNDSTTRALFGKASGQISMSDGHGKSANFTFNQTITTDTANYNLRTAAVAAGWDSVVPLVATVTINPGVVVYANSTSAYAFDTGVGFPGGTTLALVNNGYIIGMGGTGQGGFGSIISSYTPPPGTAGGPALCAQQAITVTNNGTIGGGGGGGGGGDAPNNSNKRGGAGGGGRSGRVKSSGGPGYNTSNKGGQGTFAAGGNGGNGVWTAAGEGDGGGGGGSGGDWGQTGNGGRARTGSEAGMTYNGKTDGRGYPGGAAVVGNAFITWNTTGTRMGAVT